MDLDFLTLNSEIRQHQRSPNFPRVAKIARLGRLRQKYRPAKINISANELPCRAESPRANDWKLQSRLADAIRTPGCEKESLRALETRSQRPPPLRLEQVRLRAQRQFRCGPFDVYHEIGEDTSDTRQDRRVTKPRVT